LIEILSAFAKVTTGAIAAGVIVLWFGQRDLKARLVRIENFFMNGKGGLE
jgi:hypothetical protein